MFSDALSSLQLLSAMKSKAFALGEMAQEMTQPDRKIQYLTASLHSYQLADALISELKSGYTSHESRQFIATAENETYHQAITVAAELYALTQKEVYLESAFRFSEKNKSSVLLGSLKDEEVLSAAGIPASVQAYQKKLKQNMGLLENLIHEEEESNAPSAEKRKAYEDRLLTCRLELSRTHSEMEKRSPLYARLRYKQSSLPLSAIQTAIPANTVLIEYALAGNSVYSFLISSDTVMLKKVPYDSSFNTSLSDYRRSLSGCDLSAYAQEDYNRYIQSATFLYDRLILPFEDRIQNRAVILVPEDRLGYIPFEALLTKKPSGNGMDFNSLSYWITKNPVSYSYSVALLSTPDVLQKEISPEGKYLAVAPRYSGPVSKAQSRSYAEFTSRNDLHDLPAAQEEVNNICRYAETKTYCGREATEELFKKEAPRYPVLHLAMHAVVDNEQPLYSKLVFSAGDTTEDGLLNASEIMNLDLHARMVVLSACNTGFGKILKGEGVFSLARTFLYAGCRSVVMTLWSVEDLSSAKLMDRFYYHLSQKETKSVALQQAKLEYLKNADPSHAHPYFWAGYVSIGDTSPLLSPEKEKTPLRWPFYAGMGLFGFAFVFYFRKKVAALFV